MLPVEALIVPWYYQFRSVGLINTYWAMILPQVAFHRGPVRRIARRVSRRAGWHHCDHAGTGAPGGTGDGGKGTVTPAQGAPGASGKGLTSARRVPMYERAAAQLEAEIRSGRLGADERLMSERALAERLQVSRSPSGGRWPTWPTRTWSARRSGPAGSPGRSARAATCC
jgi:hypothetical protein